MSGNASLFTTATAYNGTPGSASNAGSYAITSGMGTLNATNYSFQLVNAPTGLTVTPYTLDLAANDQTKVYGTSDPVLTYSYGSLQNGDTSSVFTGSQTRAAGENVAGGPYAISQGTLSAGNNYAIDYTGGELTITPASLTIAAHNKKRQYGLANPSFNARYTGLANGDTSSVVSGLSFATDATAASNVGSYSIIPSGGSTANYTIAYVNGTLTINPAPLTISANDATRTQGAANPPFTVTYSGLRNGDSSAVVSNLQVTSNADATSNPGLYAIIPSGATAMNYAMNYVDGTLSVGILNLPSTVQGVIGLRASSIGSESSIAATNFYNLSFPSIGTSIEPPNPTDNLVTLAPAAGSEPLTEPWLIPSNY